MAKVWNLSVKHKFADGKQHINRQAGKLYENQVGETTYLSLRLNPGVVLGLSDPHGAETFLDFYEDTSRSSSQ